MELFLHIGAHRTGSTAFQRILAKNAGVLARDGTVVWGPDELRPRRHFYLPVKDDFEPGAQAAFARDLAGVRADRLVISEENMLGNMRLNLLDRAFYPDVLRRMAAYGGLIGLAPRRIGLAIRDYASYWSSAYLYTLPRHRLPEFGALKPDILRLTRGWLDILHELRGLFPTAEIMVWPLEAVKDRMRDMVARFLDRPARELEDIDRQINVSRGAAVAPLIHAIRAETPSITPDALHEKLKTLPRPADPEPLFSDDELLGLAMRYADELSAMEAGFEGVRLVTRPGRAA